uniref:MSP domain-containing protein n=1 Tax=Musa acuminata subsp. malaccensis TaxID=214687 RepID=A0A804L7B7_MUSAM|nr:PREDICTED: vesicle-associated protein 4-2-like [Musa acuminata subsp. malaccensis]
MALAEVKAGTEGKGWGIFRLPFFGGGGGGGGGDGGSSSNSSSTFILTHNHHYRSSGQVEGGAAAAQAGRRSSGASSVSSVARSLLPTRRRLRLDPPTKLYFPYEPGKQVRSAIRIKNTSKSHVAFKFQTTVYRTQNCLSIQKFFLFQNSVDYCCYIPVQQFDEQKDQVAVEQILRVVFLDPDHPCPQMEKLKRQLAEAEAALEARKKPPEDTSPRIVGGLVIDEWKERRERYLAQQQQVEGVDSV